MPKPPAPPIQDDRISILRLVAASATKTRDPTLIRLAKQVRRTANLLAGVAMDDLEANDRYGREVARERRIPAGRRTRLRPTADRKKAQEEGLSPEDRMYMQNLIDTGRLNPDGTLKETE